ncbi:hypothetical protein G6031_03830 [Dietzia sp. CQ4]|nr:hypothetical protein [Dietzia sp. CQ4]
MSNAFAVDPGPLWSTSPGASMGEVNTTGTTRRDTRRPTATVTATLAATAVALAAALAAPATANAQDSSEALAQLLPAPNRLVAWGGSPTGACAGAVSTSLRGDGYPGSASVSWAFAVVGVGPCALTATLSWRNLDTGTSGQKVAQIPHPRISLGVPDPIAHPYDAIIPTGSGRVEYRLTTTGGAVAGPIVVDTVAYTG